MKNSSLLTVVMSLLVLACFSMSAPAQIIHTNPCTVDCVAEPPYSQIGASSVTNGGIPGIGSYRITGTNGNDRMCWLFQTTQTNRNYMAKVTVVYPSDQTRVPEIYCISGSSIYWDVNAFGSGFYTGIRNNMKNRLMTQSFYFHLPQAYTEWGMQQKFAIAIKNVATSLVSNQFLSQLKPPAVVSIKIEDIYYTNSFPAAPVEAGWENRRRLGVWWEDPSLTCDFAQHPFAYDNHPTEFPNALDRQIKTCQRTLSTSASYPVVWYVGALYNASVEYVGDYPTNWMRAHPTDYDKTMAAQYSTNNIDFYPTIRCWMLPSLVTQMVSQVAVQNNPGTNYVNAVTRYGEVRQYDPATGYWGALPLVNCIHPTVVGKITNLVAEVADRLKGYSSFKGIMIVNATSSIHGFGSLDVGYDDYTMHQFATDNGLQLPNDTSTNRFQNWYGWVQTNYWSTWLGWRSNQVYNLLSQMANIIDSKKPGAKLVFALLDPRTGTNVYAQCSIPLDCIAGNPKMSVIRMAQVDGNPGSWFDADSFSTSNTVGAISYYQYYETSFNGMPRLWVPSDWRSGQTNESDWLATSPKPAEDNVNELLAKSMAKYDPLNQFQGGFQAGTLGQEEGIVNFAKAFNTLPGVKFLGNAQYCNNSNVAFRTVSQNGKKYFYAVNTTSTTQNAGLIFTSNPSGVTTYSRYGLGADAIETIGNNQTNTYNLPPYSLVSWIGNNVISNEQAMVFFDKMENNAADSSGNANNGMAYGNPSWIAGRCGMAILLNGSNFIDVVDSPSLSITSNITVAAWIKKDPSWSSTGNILAKGANSAYRWRVNGDGTLWFLINDGTGSQSIFSGGSVSSNWHHVAVTADCKSKNVGFYVDGVLATNLPTTKTGIATTSGDLVVGAYSTNGVEGFNGAIDEVRIYNYCLTAAQIGRVFLDDNGLIFWGKMENDATDSSGNANNGTVYGSPTWVDDYTGNAIHLNTNGDYISVADSPSLSITNNLTVAAWIKKDPGATYGDILSKNANSEYRWRVNSDGTLWFLINDGTGYQTFFSGVNVSTNWHHVAVTADFKSKNVGFYVDGALATNVPTVKTGITNASAGLIIGAYSASGTEVFQGIIDEVRIYNYCLTDAQIKYMFLNY